jgi:hypothetical protein
MTTATQKRVILEVRSGAQAGRRVVLAAGETLRVGRTDKAGLVLAQDEQLSGVHFELGWDGSRCVLRDLDSRIGTLCEGEAVREAEVKSGAWLRAGQTDFSVYFEDHTPALKARPPLDPVRETALGALSAEAEKGVLFAILDAGRSDRIRGLLAEAVDEYRSLYDGVEANSMATIAPYLVQIQKGSALLRRLVEEGWGDSWGVYFASGASFRDIRAHLQRLLTAKLKEDQRIFQFRYYDPRVLRVFLPTCTARQMGDVYGEIERFVCEDEGGAVLTFSRASPPVARGGVMLTLGKPQIDAIKESVERAYARDVARYMRAEHSESVAALADDELLRRVRLGIARAESHGLTWDSSITAFVAIMFEVAPTFDEQPAIARVLKDESLAPNKRIEALWELTTDEDWDEAEARAPFAESFWNGVDAEHR